MAGVGHLAETKYSFVDELRISAIHKQVPAALPCLVCRLFCSFEQATSSSFLAVLLTLTQNDKSQDIYFFLFVM